MTIAEEVAVAMRAIARERHAANPDINRTRNRRYYLRHRQEMQARRREKYLANREHTLAVNSDYYYTNREKILAQKRASYALRKAAISALPANT